MSKEVLELFRPEIEEAAAKKMKEVIIGFYQINIPITQIAQATKMSEKQVQDIISGME